MRLNRYLSLCGVASRRAADQLIVDGKVSVNGEVITKLGTVINELIDDVKVNGKLIERAPEHVYVALNKPRGYIVTLKDDFGRKTIQGLLRGIKQRVYPVGRLDLDSDGLLLLTDDGELAFRLAHPKYGVKKLYRVRVRGKMQNDDLRHFHGGIALEDGHVARAKVKILDQDERSTIVAVELQEGRKREIRQMCKIVGFPVITLTRVRFDEINLGTLEPGKWRYLTSQELSKLKRKVGLS